GVVVATYGSFALNVTPQRYFYTPGSRAAFIVDARNYDNQPVAARAHVELLQTSYRQPDKTVLKAATDIDVGTSGPATATLDIPAEGGSYRVRVNARTPEGRDVEDLCYVWVSGRGGAEFGGDQRTVQIVTDKKTYRAGETAKLLIVGGRNNMPVYASVE